MVSDMEIDVNNSFHTVFTHADVVQDSIFRDVKAPPRDIGISECARSLWQKRWRHNRQANVHTIKKQSFRHDQDCYKKRDGTANQIQSRYIARHTTYQTRSEKQSG
jgi:hypothetical protein